MLSLQDSKLQYFFLFILMLPVFSTGVIQSLSGSAAFAEGISISVFLLVAFYNYTKRRIFTIDKELFFLSTAFFLYIFLNTLITNLYYYENYSLLSYFYISFSTILLIYVLYSLCHNFIFDEKIINKIINVLVFLGLFVSIVGILQKFFSVEFFGVHLDNDRARGLSRSTLNYSGILAIVLSLYILKAKEYSLPVILILCLGIFCGISRAYMIFSIVILFYFYLRLSFEIRLIILILFLSFLSTLLLIDIDLSFFQEKFNRILDLNVYLGGDKDRINSMLRITEVFNFFGAGLSSTGPAAARFMPYNQGFESFIINSLHQLGILVFISSYFLIRYLADIKNHKRSLVIIFAWIPPLLLTQSVENPTVLVLFVFLLSYLKSQSEKDRHPKNT